MRGEADGTLIEAGSGATAIGTSLEIQFDRYLDPLSAVRQSFCLASTAEPVSRLEDCVEGVTASPRYDPVRVTLTLYLSQPLSANVLYQLTIFAPDDESLGESTLTQGIRAFDGAVLRSNQVFSFQTGSKPSILETPPVFDVPCKGTGAPEAPTIAFALASCVGCHGGSNPSMGLALDRTDDADFVTDLLRVARQTQRGGASTEPDLRPEAFGASMPYVMPSAPGNSYLLYKLLALGPVTGVPLAVGETDRLRRSVVRGEPMPLGSPPLSELSEQTQLRRDAAVLLLGDWIAAGAPCPIDT